MMLATDASATPQDITDHYTNLFRQLHGRQPRIRHMSGDWFQVNGEIVHRNIVVEEIDQLASLCRKHRRVEKNVVKKLIARLRNL